VTDFLSYVVFMFVGILLASFFGWMFMTWWWGKDQTEEAKTTMQIVIAAILAFFGASR
jgi:predicted permease